MKANLEFNLPEETDLIGLPLTILLSIILCLILFLLICVIREHAIKLKEIVNKKFTNDIVILDGKKFIDCEFKNCILKFEGKSKFEMQGNCSIDYQCSFKAVDEKIAVWSQVLITHLSACINDGVNLAFEAKDKHNRIINKMNLKINKYDNS